MALASPSAGEIPAQILRLDSRVLRRALGVVALVLVSAGAGCAPTAPGSFRIGVFVLEEGYFRAASGIPTLQGAQLYVDSVNAAGGIVVGDRPHLVELIVERHTLQVEEVTTAARRLISQERVHALLGPQLSDHAIPVGGIAERVPLPMISPMSSNPATTAGRRHVFRVAFMDDQQARTLAEIVLAHDDGAIRHAGVLFDRTSDYGRGITETFRRVFEEGGGRVTVLEYGGRHVNDFRPELRELRAAGVDALLLPNTPAANEAVVRQLPEVELDVTLLGTDGWDIESLAALPAARGAIVTHQWDRALPDSEAPVFARRFMEQYGEPSRATAALTFDAVRILVEAAVHAGSLEAAALRQAILDLPPVRGASGWIDYADSQDPIRPVVVSTILPDGARAIYSGSAAPGGDAR